MSKIMTMSYLIAFLVVSSLALMSLAKRSEEPFCTSRFDFEEKLLHKMVRLEHSMELLENRVMKRLADFEEDRKTYIGGIRAFQDVIDNRRIYALGPMVKLSEDVLTSLNMFIRDSEDKLNETLDVLRALNHRISTRVCPDGWLEYGSSCYLFGRSELSYTAARKFCQDNKATLAQVDKTAENDFLKQSMEQLGKDNSALEPKFGYWNDAFETTSNGAEVWRETNAALDPKVADWNGKQPDDAGGKQTCTMFWKDFKYEWADIECDAVGKGNRKSDRLGRALCERPKIE